MLIGLFFVRYNHRFVSDKTGGPIAPDDVATFGYEVEMNQLKAELESNIVPIGRVRKGLYAQRAFLFKVKFVNKFNLKKKMIRIDRQWPIDLEFLVH